MTGRPRRNASAARFPTTVALRLALAMAERLLPKSTYDGELAVDPRDARFLLSGQLGAWSRWRDDLEPEHRHALDRLIAVRPRRLATEGGFRVSLASHLRNGRSPRYEEFGDLLRVGDGIPVDALITEALADLENAATPVPALPVARPDGVYTSSVFLSGHEREEYRRNTYRIPDIRLAQRPIQLIATPASPVVAFDLEALHRTAELIVKHRDDHSEFDVADQLATFSSHLRDATGVPLRQQRLQLTAGRLRLAIAPTGSGKSVFMRVAATHLANEGNVVVLLTPDVESTLNLVADIRADIDALGLDLRVAALMSSRRLVDIAIRRSDDAPDEPERARWTWNEFGYSCLLPGEDGTVWQPGQEPCTDLQEPGQDGRYQCPLIGICEKWRPWRQAAGPARIIVTNHAYFQQGSVPIPVEIDGDVHGRISAQEFLLRRASIVFIDEVDAFQTHAVQRSGRTLVLARRDTHEDLLLEKLDRQRKEQVFAGNVPGDLELDFQRAIHRLDYLPERYLTAVVRGFIDPRDPLGPRQARLHLPRRWDNLLACRLFGLDELEDRPDDEQLEQFKKLFTTSEPDNLPDGWSALRRQLRLVVSDQPDSDRLEQRREDLVEALTEIPGISNDVDRLETVQLLLRRAFLGEMQQCLAELERLLPLMRDSGMRLADEVEAALDRGSAWQATPEGPIGRAVFGFATTGDPNNTSDRQLNAEIISGDPHAYTAELGLTTAAALTGAPRVVLGLSATAYLPGAPTMHVHADIACYYPDDASRGTGTLTIHNASISDRSPRRPRGITVSGAARGRKPQLLTDIGAGLWEELLERRLARLKQDPQQRDRARVLLVTNSYEQGAYLCSGLIRGGAQRTRLVLAVPADDDHNLQIPDEVMALPATRLGSFPDTGRDVLISPFARVARGLNIVVGRKSALDSIWVCVRPIRLIDEPSALVAHTGARARLGRGPADDPRTELDARHDIAAKHLEKINRSNPAFGRLPADVRMNIFADVLADLIQLAGRARRGGTDTSLFLVDNAFHRGGSAPGSDFASLVKDLHQYWVDKNILSQVTSIYGTTLGAFLAFAGITDRNH